MEVSIIKCQISCDHVCKEEWLDPKTQQEFKFLWCPILQMKMAVWWYQDSDYLSYASHCGRRMPSKASHTTVWWNLHLWFTNTQLRNIKQRSKIQHGERGQFLIVKGYHRRGIPSWSKNTDLDPQHTGPNPLCSGRYNSLWP